MPLIIVLILASLAVVTGCNTVPSASSSSLTSHASSEPHRRSIAIGGVALSILEAGTGDPIIYVHGVVTTSNIFSKYLSAYSPDFRWIAVDLRGYGDSEKPAGGFTIKQFSKDLVALADTLGIEKPVWVGVSMGGMILQQGGALEGLGLGIPLVIQDKTFVPHPDQLAWQDPTWDPSWGGLGNLWYHHVYMPAQNPGDPGGMSAYGRWMYGPWFWPPAGDAKYGPIANPYYNMVPNSVPPFSQPLAVPCNLDDPNTWQYQIEPFCEPEFIPGTPNISAGMEQFNDMTMVNGTAYPTLTVEPKAYRFRILSAANDRFFNFQWYVGDPTTASTSLNSLGNPSAQLKWRWIRLNWLRRNLTRSFSRPRSRTLPPQVRIGSRLVPRAVSCLLQ